MGHLKKKNIRPSKFETEIEVFLVTTAGIIFFFLFCLRLLLFLIFTREYTGYDFVYSALFLYVMVFPGFYVFFALFGKSSIGLAILGEIGFIIELSHRLSGKLIHSISIKPTTKSEVSNLIISLPLSRKLFKLAAFLYSQKTQKEVLEAIVADWEEEYFQALFKKELRKARWINLRYTYAFLAAMWQKSPIGDLIEFVTKIAKQ